MENTDPNLFLSILQRHRNGGLLGDASAAFSELIQGVRLTGKPGTLTVKLTLQPASRGQGLVILKDDINDKIPKVEAEQSVWFATEDGRLQKDDPRQQRLGLTVHSIPTINPPAPAPATTKRSLLTMPNQNENSRTEADETLITQLEHAERLMPALDPPAGFHGRPVKLVPAGWTLAPVPGWEPTQPDMIVSDVVLRDVGSFCSYVNKYKGLDTLLLSSEEGSCMWALIDYHGPGNPSWCRHRAKLELKPDPDWLAWLKNDGKEMTQEAFAEFLEDHLRHIIKPEAAELMAAVNAFTVEGSLKFSRVQRSFDGTVKFELLDERKASLDSIALGDRFELALCFYDFQTDPVPVTARLRYRLSKDGELSLWYVLKGWEDAKRVSWQVIRDDVASDTNLEALEGGKV